MKYLNIVFLSVLSVMLLASCSKNDNLEQMIPEDATGVISINTKNILEKGAILNDKGEVSIPECVQTAINANDASAIGAFIKSLPSSGLKYDSNIYIYFTNKLFSSVLLANINDEEATQKWLLKLSDEGKMSHDSDCDYIISGMNVYATYENILFIGNLNKMDEVGKIIKYVKKNIENSGRSILDNKDAMAALGSKSDVVSYMTMKGLNNRISGSESLRGIVNKIPLIRLFLESDIKAIITEVEFGKEAKIKINAQTGAGSQYVELINTVIGKPSSEFLKVMPASMTSIISLSINGNKLTQMKDFGELTSALNKIPLLGYFDLTKMISVIDGPVAIGFNKDINFNNEYNIAIAITTKDPKQILSDINHLANMVGQQPQKVGGEYIYDYYNQQITVGIKGDVVYFKMLNYEQTDGFAYDNARLKSFFDKSAIGLYLKAETSKGELMLGSVSATEGVGAYLSNSSENINIVDQILILLSGIKPISGYDDFGGVGYAPIDNMTGI